MEAIYLFFVGCFTFLVGRLEAGLSRHMAKMLALVVRFLSGKPLLQAKNSTGHRWMEPIRSSLQITWPLLQAPETIEPPTPYIILISKITT